MRQVIDGKVYDTDTAELIAEWSNGYNCNDFSFDQEELYLTRKGVWFMRGRGYGQHRVAVGNRFGWGDKIVLLSAANAQRWLENRGASADLIERHFAVEAA